MRSRTSLLAAAALGITVVLTACVDNPMSPEPPSTVADSIALDNCGTDVAFDAPPSRVVTIKSTSTEMLLALGLGDRIIGTAFQDGPLPSNLLEAGSELTSISDQVPSQEAVLDLEPDLVYGGWESNFSADGAGERDELHTLGIATYVSPAACKEEGYQPDPLTWDAVFGEIAEVGDIFDVDEAATELVQEQRAQLDAIEENTGGHTALWYSSGTDTPYVGAGIGAPQLLLDTIGLENITGDVDDTWTSSSWEAIVAANPDVIVLIDAVWNTAQSKMDRLKSDPVTAKLDAVINERYLVLPFPAGEAGVRSAPAAVDLAEQLEALELDRQ